MYFIVFLIVNLMRFVIILAKLLCIYVSTVTKTNTLNTFNSDCSN